MHGQQGQATLPAALRSATREAHWALDRHPLLESLAQPSLTLAQYGHVMAALHGPHAVLEEAVQDWLARRPELNGLRPRRRVPILERDLADLGLSPAACTAELPAPASLGELIGILYALDSSLLGGRFLARQIRQQLGDGVPLRFLEVDPAETRWQAIWQHAGRHSGGTEQTAAVAAALAAFRGLKQHLDDQAGTD